jgi:BlaI family penicillinase repressor
MHYNCRVATTYATNRETTMTERRKGTIHETEWDLLEALWSRERATAREVSEVLAKKRGWAVSTVKTLLDRMVQKNLVSARQVGNVWEYTPAVKPAEARRSAWSELVDKAFGGAVAPALQFLATEAKLSKKDLAELRALLDKKEKGHE